MNNKRPGMGEQLLRSLLLSFAIMWLISTFFGWPGQNKNSQNVTRDPKLTAQATLENAFKDLDPARAITAEAAKAEVGTLQTAITANSSDIYARWAHLRSGLLQQYILKQPADALKNYDAAAAANKVYDPINAQALFQKGDWQWFSAKDGVASTPLTPTHADAVVTLETIYTHERSDAKYLQIPIYLPAIDKGTKTYDPNVLPAEGFKTVKLGELRGTLDNPNPQGVLDRINQHYAGTVLTRGFDVLVNAYGARPATSYGFAILTLAVLLRVLMQPINKRQYDSMKGMAKLGPEMKKIQERLKPKPNDSPEVAREKQMRSFQEVRELQKQHGVNPQMGCALAFVQMPVFFYIINPLMKHYEPKMDLVGASFAWIPSLAYPDYVLLALYGVSMLVSFRLSATPPSGQMDEMQKQMQLMTTWIMPIMLPFFMIGFSSAFILYWIGYNVVSTAFQYWMMKQADPDRDFWKVLLGKTDTPAEPALAVAAVPPRPKSAASLKSQTSLEKAKADTTKVTKVTKVKSLSAEEPTPTNGHVNGTNGSAQANGKPEASGITMSKPGESSDKDSADGSKDAPGGNNGSAAQRARRRRRY